MQQFRNLTDKVFFKIFLAFIAVSFVMFGVSSFIAGPSNQWVVKVGDKRVTQNEFMTMMRRQSSIALREKGGVEAERYLNSAQFQQDMLNAMVSRKMFEIVGDHFNFRPNSQIILQEIAKDNNFRDENNKFDRDSFDNFLQYNSIDERDYIAQLAQDTSSNIAIRSLSAAAPISEEIAIAQAQSHRQKRVADIITIDKSVIGKVAKPGEEDLKKYFADNKEQFVVPVMRQISYLHFDKERLTKDIKLKDAEVRRYYDVNLEEFVEPQTRNSYHLLFEDEQKAQTFLQKYESAIQGGANSKKTFAKLAKDIAGEDEQSIKLDNVTIDGIFPELAKAIFALEVGQNSKVVESQIGFHVALLTQINQPKQLPFAKVKRDIEIKLLAEKSEKMVQDKMAAIDDNMLLTNSITETAQKFSLRYSRDPLIIDVSGRDKAGNEPKIIGEFDEFLMQSFALQEGQFSDLLYDEKNGKYYIIKVDKVIPQKQKEYDEVKSQLAAQIIEQKTAQKLKEFSDKIYEEIEKNTKSFTAIAKKNKLKLDRNKTLPRQYIVTLADKSQVPYQDDFLYELFRINIGDVTPLVKLESGDYIVALLKNIKKNNIDKKDFKSVITSNQNRFKAEILEVFNQYLSAKYPVEFNKNLQDFN